jgi:hypothetical protein
MRYRILAACAGVVAAVTAASVSAAQTIVKGGCQLQASATVTPGLTLTSQRFHFAYRGRLSHCYYTGTGAANGGTINAGEQITIDGHKYQEPAPGATGSCLVTKSTGYDFAFWDNGTQTIVKYTTTSASGVTHITGSVWPSLQLAAVDPKPGQPKTITFNTTNFNGQTVLGRLKFTTSNPSVCATSHGLTSASISGTLIHHGVPRTPTAHSLKCANKATGEVCNSSAPAQKCPSTTRSRTCDKHNRKHMPKKTLRLNSLAFAGGAAIPARYTCQGGSTSPPLQWSNVPAGTKELELLVNDSTVGNLSHWVLYAISPRDTGAPEGSTPTRSKQGVNGSGQIGYLAPCPIVGATTHRYVFELFASKKALSLPPRPTDHDVRTALQGNTLATATLTGTYALHT